MAYYRYFVVLLYVLAIATSNISEASGRNAIALGEFKIDIKQSEVSGPINLGEALLLETKKAGEITTYIYRHAPATSILNAKVRLRELKGYDSSFKTIKQKRGALFYFKSDAGQHFFSTVGGYLIITGSDLKSNLGNVGLAL